MHFDEDVVSTMGTNTLRYPRPSPINSAKMVFLHIIHINGRGGISQQILYRFQSELEERYTLTASLIRRRYKKCEDQRFRGVDLGLLA